MICSITVGRSRRSRRHEMLPRAMKRRRRVSSESESEQSEQSSVEEIEPPRPPQKEDVSCEECERADQGEQSESLNGELGMEVANPMEGGEGNARDEASDDDEIFATGADEKLQGLVSSADFVRKDEVLGVDNEEGLGAPALLVSDEEEDMQAYLEEGEEESVVGRAFHAAEAETSDPEDDPRVSGGETNGNASEKSKGIDEPHGDFAAYSSIALRANRPIVLDDGSPCDNITEPNNQIEQGQQVGLSSGEDEERQESMTLIDKSAEEERHTVRRNVKEAEDKTLSAGDAGSLEWTREMNAVCVDRLTTLLLMTCRERADQYASPRTACC